jgi:hypothetical protein
LKRLVVVQVGAEAQVDQDPEVNCCVTGCVIAERQPSALA